MVGLNKNIITHTKVNVRKFLKKDVEDKILREWIVTRVDGAVKIEHVELWVVA